MSDRVEKPHDRLTPSDLELSPCWYNPDVDRRAIHRIVTPLDSNSIGDAGMQADGDSLWAADMYPTDARAQPYVGVVRGGRAFVDPWSASPRLVLPRPIGEGSPDPGFERFDLAVDSRGATVVRLALPRLSREQPRFGVSRHEEGVQQVRAVLRAMGVEARTLFPLRVALRVQLRNWPREFSVPGFMAGDGHGFEVLGMQ